MLILGSDFLPHHHLLVDRAGSRLLDASTLEQIPAVFSMPASKTSELYAALLSTSEEFRDLLSLLKVLVLLFLSIRFVILFQQLLDHQFLLKPGG